ncbi:MAG TPA: hypothetical protein VLW65_21100, partial [Bryobacteraceae bacterium]|nr:hypothetical protein [Bryobacteraceae bacterium]
SILVMHKALADFFAALHSSSSGILSGETYWVSGFRQYTNFVGLPEYRTMEHEYLPAPAAAR